MDVKSGEAEYAAWRRDRDAEERLLDRFRNPDDPLKILIVTSKLLTGFDAPILQAMYLDKPLRDHTLLQAICRTNRPCGDAKTHGLIVDYLGVFDDVAQAIQFDEEGITRVVTNLNELAAALPAAVRKCLAWFPGVDRSVTGYAGLIAAQECLPDGAARGRLRRRLQRPVAPLGSGLARREPGAVRGRLPLAEPGLRVDEAVHRHRPAPLARARPADRRDHPAPRPRRRRPRRPGDAGARCRRAGRGARRARPPKGSRRRSRSRSPTASAGTCTTRASRPSASGSKRCGGSTSRACSSASSS